MSFIDRFLNAIKLNDDFDEDEDFLDEEDDLLDEEDDGEEDRPKARKRFFSKFSFDDDEDDEEDEDEFEETPRASAKSSARSASAGRGASAGRSASSAGASAAAARTRTEKRKEAAPASHRVGYASPGSTSSRSSAAGSRAESQSRGASKKAAAARKRNPALSMEVNVVRPSSMEDTREIADTLMDNCTVVLNLEGLDVEIAQRVIDFTCGACYSLHGNLQKISSYIFILTPEDVDISGDFQTILDGAFDLPSMRAGY
ncbi:MAG: cell division protein SepF [Lachnospiraceae bacterium]|nr:cell division protein SepF [Lachnospiraceae bacterium]